MVDIELALSCYDTKIKDLFLNRSVIGVHITSSKEVYLSEIYAMNLVFEDNRQYYDYLMQVYSRRSTESPRFWVDGPLSDIIPPYIESIIPEHVRVSKILKDKMINIQNFSPRIEDARTIRSEFFSRLRNLELRVLGTKDRPTIAGFPRERYASEITTARKPRDFTILAA